MAPVGTYELDSKTERMLLEMSGSRVHARTAPVIDNEPEPTIAGFYCPAWCWSIPPLAIGLIASVCGWGL